MHRLDVRFECVVSFEESIEFDPSVRMVSTCSIELAEMFGTFDLHRPTAVLELAEFQPARLQFDPKLVSLLLDFAQFDRRRRLFSTSTAHSLSQAENRNSGVSRQLRPEASVAGAFLSLIVQFEKGQRSKFARDRSEATGYDDEALHAALLRVVPSSMKRLVIHHAIDSLWDPRAGPVAVQSFERVHVRKPSIDHDQLPIIVGEGQTVWIVHAMEHTGWRRIDPEKVVVQIEMDRVPVVIAHSNPLPVSADSDAVRDLQPIGEQPFAVDGRPTGPAIEYVAGDIMRVVVAHEDLNEFVPD